MQKREQFGARGRSKPSRLGVTQRWEVELKCTDSDISLGLGLLPGVSFPYCVRQVKGGAGRFYARHCPLLVPCSLGQVGGGWPAATLRRLPPVGGHRQPSGGWVSESPGW